MRAEDGWGSDGGTAGDTSGDEGPNPGHACGICCCGSITFTAFMLFACSFQGLAATNYGLTKNTVTGVVDLTNVYHGGRNCIGFWKAYVTFPSTIQTLAWRAGAMDPTAGAGPDLAPMDIRAQDGLMVRISAAAQYQIVEAKVGEIYQGYKENIQGFFISNLRSRWAEVISAFKSSELWNRRLEVVTSMRAACIEISAAPNKLNGMLTCWDIQFLGVTVDAAIEAQIEQTQVENQMQSMQKFTQQARVVRANIQVMASEYDANIGVITAQAEANAFQTKQKATSNAKLMWLEAKAGALTTIHDTVVTSADGTTKMDNAQLLQYLEKTAIAEDDTSPIVYGDFSKNTLTFTQEL